MNEIQSTVNPIDQVLIHTSRDCDNAEPHVSAEAGTSRRAPMTHVEAWERPTATTAYLTIELSVTVQ
jgi:hypothetical protein